MPKVQIQGDAKARETREYPDQPRQSADQGQTDRHAQATPDSCQHFENHPLPRRINDRGNCGQSAARVKVNARAERSSSSANQIKHAADGGLWTARYLQTFSSLGITDRLQPGRR